MFRDAPMTGEPIPVVLPNTTFTDKVIERLFDLAAGMEMSNRQLAAELGLSPAIVSRVSRGERRPAASTLDRMVEWLRENDTEWACSLTSS